MCEDVERWGKGVDGGWFDDCAFVGLTGAGKSIYYLRNEEAATKFQLQMLHYTSHPIASTLTRHEQSVPRICVVGACRSGSTSVASRVALSLDLVHLTIPKVLSLVLECGADVGVDVCIYMRKSFYLKVFHQRQSYFFTLVDWSSVAWRRLSGR